MYKPALKRISDNLPCYMDADGAIRACNDHSLVRMHHKTLTALIMGCQIVVGADGRVSLTDTGRATLRAKRSNRSYYESRKAKGDVQVTVWVPAERTKELKEYAETLFD